MKQQKEAISCQTHGVAITCILLVVLLVLFPGLRLAAAQVPRDFDTQLTDAEREWLAQHPRIQVGIMDAWPPLNYLDQNKIPQGIGMEYLAAVNKRLSGALVPVPAPFKENYDRVLNGQLDALMDISQRPDRELLFTFTRPYIVIPHVIVGRKGGDYFKTEQNLVGKTIALERGFHNITYFKTNYPGVVIREYGSTSEALDAVSRGEVDAYAGNRAVVIHLIEKELLNNLRLMGKLTEPKSILQIGVQKELPLLASIIDKALASLTVDEERVIRQKWLQESSPGLDLTEAEQAWLKAHPAIRVALDPAWAPIEFLDQHDIPQGISADYLQKIGELLGVHFDIAKGQDWPGLVEGVKSHHLDMFSSLLRTEERAAYLGFTDNYLSLPIGIFTRQDAQYITSMDELVGKKIAIIKGHAVEEILKNKHPELQLCPSSSMINAIQKLTEGQVDAVVDSTISTGYYLNQLGTANIKLAGEIPYRYDLAMGVRSDWPELVPILNKALRTLPESEQNAIYSKWTSRQQEQKVDYSLIWKIVGGALVVVLLFALWNRRLGREIDIRKQAEVQLQASQLDLLHSVEELHLKQEELEAANHKLQDLDRLKSMFIASMSHELRTPLNSIIGFTGMTLQGLSGDLNEEQKDNLSRAYQSAKHLLSLITDVIDISKIEAGRIDIYPESIPLRMVVNEAIATIEPQLKEKGLTLDIDVPDGLLLTTDKKRLLQCLINLLSNGVKFTEKGGLRLLAACEQEESVTIAVTDTGIGIAESDLPKLFEAFERLETHLRVKVGGTGLGLYLTRKIATDLLHGQVSVQSRIDEGSTFTLTVAKTLPRVAEA
jgi:signal transduction histidine kinase